ncbi:auxin-responsive protein IAA31 [Cicer arietinum]|uniref:Auxin-induced protein n=1 Tax=Cicer arietinum TaxID=3827 RepID=A0A1S2YPW3_CICAR|nr:auxin-responsive protein IAA31 [Cicer arietinum]
MGTLEQQIDAYQTQSSSSSSSSIDSNNYPSSLCLSTLCRKRTDNLSTDLRLGLSISPPSSSHQSQLPFISTTPREEAFDWPPIKSTLRTTLVEKQSNFQSQKPSLFVKVYMEGIPIGRKLNLLAHHSYDGLVKALCHMFRTIILCPNSQPLNPRNFHVLTYEDQEGDWMMVGDVPWEMFLSSVKRLKITRANSC